MLVANSYITQGKAEEYKAIRSLWNERETKKPAWFVLDADYLILEGRDKEATDLLLSETFEGKLDVGRLVRLALINVNENPKKAWDYLSKAYKIDPDNPDIRSYRARMLEGVGRNALAHAEYKAAIALRPNDVFLKDQLANFYLRKNQYTLALSVWKGLLEEPSLDTIWVKTLFWNKVTTPIEFDWDAATPPKGVLRPLITYYSHLAPKVFWDEVTFDQIPNGKDYLKAEQSTFWLRVIQALEDRDEKQAHRLITYNPFHSVSWQPELEQSLLWVLNYRKTGMFIPGTSPIKVDEASRITEEEKGVQFFEQLERIAKQSAKNEGDVVISQSMHDLLTGDVAFSAVFIAAGWSEVAIDLNQTTVIPSNYPQWVAFRLTQAIHKNRGNIEALEFATIQEQTPEMRLLTGELFISGDNPDAGLEKLSGLISLKGDIGYRASWLTSLLYLEKGNYKEAKSIIMNNAKLKDDTLGKETLGRIALREGDTATADKIYSSLEEESAEARSYLARRAYTEKNWQRAKELTERLIKDFPDNFTLRENLIKIAEEQKKQANIE